MFWFSGDSNRRWSSSLKVPKSEHYTSDALIVVEFNLIETPSTDTGSTEVLQIASVQFNSLDIIGLNHSFFFLNLSNFWK